MDITEGDATLPRYTSKQRVLLPVQPLSPFASSSYCSPRSCSPITHKKKPTLCREILNFNSSIWWMTRSVSKFSALSSAECGESRPISWQLLWLVASLETGRSRFGAVRLSQCSKRLRDITQPVLFHVFHSPVRHSSKATHRSLAAFVRILFSRPDLALSVRSLVLSAYDDEDLLRSCSSLFDPELRLVPDNVTFVRAADGLASWWEEVLTRCC